MNNRATIDKTPAPNNTYPKVAVQCSADTFVVNESSVLRMNICGKNRHLRVAAKRYASLYGDRANNKLTNKKYGFYDNK